MPHFLGTLELPLAPFGKDASVVLCLVKVGGAKAPWSAYLRMLHVVRKAKPRLGLHIAVFDRADRDGGRRRDGMVLDCSSSGGP